MYAPLLPNFYIAGAMKSGTSALWWYLSQHPDIFMAEIKEPHFWVDNRRYPDLTPYLALFKDGQDKKIRGEASTGYLIYPDFISRMTEYTPEARIILVLRNPVDRAYSHYWFSKGRGYEKHDFRKAFLLRKDENPDFAATSITTGNQYYYQTGLYGSQLSRFREFLPAAQIHIMESGDLKHQPLKTLNAGLRFLGLPEFDTVSQQIINPTYVMENPKEFKDQIDMFYGKNLIKDFLKKIIPYSIGQKVRHAMAGYLERKAPKTGGYPPLSQEDRIWLADWYREDVKLLRKISGLPFQQWKDFP